MNWLRRLFRRFLRPKLTVSYYTPEMIQAMKFTTQFQALTELRPLPSTKDEEIKFYVQ